MAAWKDSSWTREQKHRDSPCRESTLCRAGQQLSGQELDFYKGSQGTNRYFNKHAVVDQKRTKLLRKQLLLLYTFTLFKVGK